jgi:hypothetical protein
MPNACLPSAFARRHYLYMAAPTRRPFPLSAAHTGLGGMSQAAMTPEEKEARKKKQQVRIAAGCRRRVAVWLPHTFFLLGGGGSSQEGQGGGGSSQEGRGGGGSSQEGRGGGGSSQEGRGGGAIRAVQEACVRRATVRVWQCAVAGHCVGNIVAVATRPRGRCIRWSHEQGVRIDCGSSVACCTLLPGAHALEASALAHTHARARADVAQEAEAAKMGEEARSVWRYAFCMHATAVGCGSADSAIVARDALPVRGLLCAHSAVSRACCCRPSSFARRRRRPRCVPCPGRSCQCSTCSTSVLGCGQSVARFWPNYSVVHTRVLGGFRSNRGLAPFLPSPMALFPVFGGAPKESDVYIACRVSRAATSRARCKQTRTPCPQAWSGI